MGNLCAAPTAKSDARARAKKSAVADKVTRAEKSGILNLSESSLKDIPQKVLSLSLKNLNVSNNALEKLPNNFSNKFTNLKVLNLSTNKLTIDAESAKQVFFHLNSLTTLALDNNLLNHLPVFPVECKLTKLTMSHNTLSKFPETLRSLAKLKELDLSHNKIQGAVPSWIGTLKNLESIELGWNQLTTVPSELSTLERLFVLQLQSNQLAEIPSAILADSKVLNRIQLEGNKITKEKLTALDGFDKFDKRRQQRINKKIAAGLETDRSICGLD